MMMLAVRCHGISNVEVIIMYVFVKINDSNQ